MEMDIMAGLTIDLLKYFVYQYHEGKMEFELFKEHAETKVLFLEKYIDKIDDEMDRSSALELLSYCKEILDCEENK